MKTESADFIRGLKRGIWLYAWWEDGIEYVGSCGTTKKEALERIDREYTVRELPSEPEQGQGERSCKNCHHRKIIFKFLCGTNPDDACCPDWQPAQPDKINEPEQRQEGKSCENCMNKEKTGECVFVYAGEPLKLCHHWQPIPDKPEITERDERIARLKALLAELWNIVEELNRYGNYFVNKNIYNKLEARLKEEGII